MQARCWCFTVNFSYLSDYEQVDPAEWKGCVVAVWQHEVGERGTEHLQGYVNFSAPKRLAAVKKLGGLERAHLEPRKGTKLDNLVYCTKEEGRLDGPFYFPTKEKVESYCAVENGGRADLKTLADLVVRGLSDREIAAINPCFILKFQKHIDHLRVAIARPGRAGQEIDSVVYVGPTGTGKSYRLEQECPPGPDWFWVTAGKWFDGYQGEPGLVFDEFRDSWMQYQSFLRLVDIRPNTVEKKGGHLLMRAYRFRFSTNVHPMSWWSGVVKPAWEGGPLQRRLPFIVLMVERFEAPQVRFDNAAEWWAAQPEAVPPAVRAQYGQRMDD